MTAKPISRRLTGCAGASGGSLISVRAFELLEALVLEVAAVDFEVLVPLEDALLLFTAPDKPDAFVITGGATI